MKKNAGKLWSKESLIFIRTPNPRSINRESPPDEIMARILNFTPTSNPSAPRISRVPVSF